MLSRKDFLKTLPLIAGMPGGFFKKRIYHYQSRIKIFFEISDNWQPFI
jgi:hypothetical protein